MHEVVSSEQELNQAFRADFQFTQHGGETG